MAKRDPRLRAFVKVQKRTGLVIPGTMILRDDYPKSNGPWFEIIPNICCTTTTTTTSTTTTTTTTP